MKSDVCLDRAGALLLTAMPDLHTRLLAAPPARIAILGCGTGMLTICLAATYPTVWIDGFDLDTAAIDAAWSAAARYALTDRVTFHVRAAHEFELLNGAYDLAIASKCVSTLGNPTGVLRAMRRLAGDHGAMLAITPIDRAALWQWAQAAGMRHVKRVTFGTSAIPCYRLDDGT